MNRLDKLKQVFPSRINDYILDIKNQERNNMSTTTITIPRFGSESERLSWFVDLTSALASGDVVFNDANGNATMIDAVNCATDGIITHQGSRMADVGCSAVNGYYSAGGWHQVHIYKITAATTTATGIIVRML